MMLIEETSAPDAALPVEEFKAHLRLGTGFDQDTLQDEVLRSFLRAAMAAIEARTSKVLLERTFGWSLTLMRDPSALVLPVAPVSAIVGVERVARDGVRTTVDPQLYWLEKDQQRPRLRAQGSQLPSIPSNGTFELQFLAGYGADWSAVPSDLRQATMLLAAHYYEYRNETTLSDGCMPFGVSSLIERYKVMRLWAGGVQ